MASRSAVIWIVSIWTFSLHLDNFGAFATNCYYPNGDLASGEAPCSKDGGTCCPLNWQCMSNGLCYLPNEGYYERHTCTDQSWKSDSCPEICTQDDSASGNEAMLWCSSGQWCCDGNRSWNCCTKAGTNYFSLDDPHSVAFISSIPAQTPLKSSSSSSSRSASSDMETIPIVSSSAPPSSSSSTPTPTLTTAESSPPSTTTRKVVTTGENGSVSTVTKAITVVPSQSRPHKATPSSEDHSGSNLGMIVGLALGIPLALIVSGIIVFCLVRRYRKNKSSDNLPRAESPPIMANYHNLAPGSHAPELDSYPVASEGSKDGRKSELYGSDAYIHSPSMSTMTNGTTPPQYSPKKSPAMNSIQEEPQELWGGYVPYRPPQTSPPADTHGVT